MQKTDHPENSFLGVPLKKNSQGGINKLNWYTFELKYWYTFQLIYTGLKLINLISFFYPTI